jgi:uncharacterized protein (DUF305 family)
MTKSVLIATSTLLIAASGPWAHDRTDEHSFSALMAQAMQRMHDAMIVEPTGNPDRDFAAMMIPHHQGSVDMARAQLQYGKDERLRRLALEIIIEQEQEIAVMQDLFRWCVGLFLQRHRGRGPAIA